MAEENPKFEIRNPKPARLTQNTNDRNAGVGQRVRFEFRVLAIRLCFGFRISNFGFPSRQAEEAV
ncbi:MAG TPA: hypothetical protein PKH24_08685 [Sedimentisphaerales bacterium]|jgi:hypothetical protein|nr:hypothetical protein [Sedimentisphaerales bacterium]HNU28841.1 hypothetical protein [Sedimentisphaerales bacterium]